MSQEPGDNNALLVTAERRKTLSRCYQCLDRWITVVCSPLTEALAGSSLLWFIYVFFIICFYFLLVFVTKKEGENSHIIADLFLIICMVFGFLAQIFCLYKSSNTTFVQFGRLGQEHSTTYLMAGIYVFGIGTLVTIVLRLLVYYHAHELIVNCQLKKVSQIPLVDILQAGIHNTMSNTSKNATSLLLSGGYCYIDIAFDATRLLFTLLQLCFIQTFREATFKRSIFVQFALYHTIMTNGCVWIRYVVDETHLFHETEYHTSIDEFTTKAFHMEEIMIPFILEYSLLAAGLLYTISSHMDTLLPQEAVRTPSLEANANGGHDPNSHGEHHRAAGSQPGLICGAFFGLLLPLSSLMFSEEQTKFSKRSHDFFLAYEGALALLQIIAIVWTLSLLQRHRKSAHKLHSEDTLLLIGYLGTFAFHWVAIYCICKVLSKPSPESEGTDVLTLMHLLILVVSHFLQTILVIISRRYSLIREQEDSAKKIRQLALFMLTTNLGFWALDSFVEMKDGASSSYPSGEMELKGSWSVVTSITYPFVVFFRFHSAEMLYELWSRFRRKEQP